ncbi:MAG: saccharopine dehydrogenase NADP-binding domain-containing protein [Pseudomonadota bacterium]
MSTMHEHDGFMIYGAYGYTGELIARRCAARGLRPVLCGRDATRLGALADALGLPARPCALEDPRLAEALHDIQLVLHCAGPFSSTAQPMLAATLSAGAHYLDITGEVAVFELAQGLDARAREGGVVVCPGVGFDVVPTDCVAMTLAAAMPSATHLSLAFDSRSSLSPGTTRTSIEGVAAGGRARVDGKLVREPLAHRTRQIDFGTGEKLTMAITWGDLVTASHSTAIPNIDVYVPISPGALKRLRQLRPLGPLLHLPGALWLAKELAGRQARGPDADARATHATTLWGEVVDERTGECKVARLTTANGYEVTVEAALAIARHVLEGNCAGGYHTPGQLMGADFVSSLPGSSAIAVSDG